MRISCLRDVDALVSCWVYFARSHAPTLSDVMYDIDASALRDSRRLNAYGTGSSGAALSDITTWVVRSRMARSPYLLVVPTAHGAVGLSHD